MSPEILALAERMEAEFKANEHKGDWRDQPTWEDRNAIFAELAWHQAKLLIALEAGEKEKIAEHTADMANLYLMLAMSAGVFRSDPRPAPMRGPYRDDWY